jgi:hypothetical protein
MVVKEGFFCKCSYVPQAACHVCSEVTAEKSCRRLTANPEWRTQMSDVKGETKHMEKTKTDGR